MNLRLRIPKACLAVALVVLRAVMTPQAAHAQAEKPAPLPEELRGAKIYHFPDETKPGQAPENPVIYKNLSYQDIDFTRLALNLYLSIKPSKRGATIRKIYFQDVRVSGVPVHIENFDREFKLSKSDTVDLPAPLHCSIVFADLESLAPLKEIVSQDKLRVTGQSFIEVKLNALEKMALRTKQLALPVTLSEEVPLEMFSGSPFLQMAVGKVLDALSDPTSTAALALAKDHLAEMARQRALGSLAGSVYLLDFEYVLRDPKTGAEEKLSQAGTGFAVSGDGELLTAKRVVEPWKFDPQVAFLINRYHLEVDPKGQKLWAWPAGAEVLMPDGKLNYAAAEGTEKQNLRVLRAAPDRMEKLDYRDADSGATATLSIHAPGEGDVALLQLAGAKTQPLPFSDASTASGPDASTFLLGFPFGLNQPISRPQTVSVKGTKDGALIKLDHEFNPGEAGAPLVSSEGKVLGLASAKNECIPIESARSLIP